MRSLAAAELDNAFFSSSRGAQNSESSSAIIAPLPKLKTTLKNLLSLSLPLPPLPLFALAECKWVCLSTSSRLHWHPRYPQAAAHSRASGSPQSLQQRRTEMRGPVSLSLFFFFSLSMGTSLARILLPTSPRRRFQTQHKKKV